MSETFARYTVVGMTCEHCVRAVTTAIEQIDGVRRVDVELTSGIVSVMSQRELDLDAVSAAVDEAGYRIAR
jgi:copper chaperone